MSCCIFLLTSRCIVYCTGAIFSNLSLSDVYIPEQLVIRSSSFVNNSAADDAGGAICLKTLTKLTVSNSTIQDSRSGTYGAAVSVEDSTANIETTAMLRNSAVWGGGAISVNGISRLTITNSSVEACRGPFAGGLMIRGSSIVDIIGTSFRQNRASSFPETSIVQDAQYGGGAISIASINAVVTVTNSEFSENQATFGYGGAIAQASGNISLHMSRFHNNSAFLNGGAFFAVGAKILLSSCSFTSNRAADGGAIFRTSLSDSLSSDFDVTECLFESNVADGSGGAIELASGFQATVPVLITSTTFRSNRALRGGAVDVSEPLLAQLTNVTFENNEAGAISQPVPVASTGILIPEGGAIRAKLFEQLSFSSCSFRNNSALAGLGGALLFSIDDTKDTAAPSLSFSNSTFAMNEAKAGGAAYMAGTSFVLRPAFITAGTASFNNNRAMYGPDLASDGAILQWFPAPELQMRRTLRSGSELAIGSNISDPLTSVGPAASSAVPVIRVYLYDHFGQIVRWMAELTTFVLQARNESSTDLSGSVRTTMSSTGDILYVGVRVAASLGNQSVFVTGTRSNGGATVTLQTDPFNFTVVPCAPGEYRTVTVQSVHGICRRCAFNQFSLDGVECRSCPTGAICQDGAIMVQCCPSDLAKLVSIR